jgi:glycosyltransferase involved in cell wall biosynthesis
MKVLFIVTAYPRHEGDIITPWMGETISRLREAGTDVEVLAPAYKGGGATGIDGVKVHRFRYAPSSVETLTHDMPAVERIKRSPAFAALLPSYIAAGSQAAARIAREGNFDVVHAFWPIPHGIFGVAARNASRAALVSTFFSAELMWSGALRTAFAPILRRIINNSDAITVISSYTAQRLNEYVSGVETVTIPFGAAAKNQGSITPSHRKAGDAFELLFVGRLVKRKGVDVLLNAVKRLETDKRFHLRIVGGGPELGALKALASDLGVTGQVTFDGVVTNERIAELFRQCDALVLPAIVTETGDTEGLGVVLIEAMGYGKPVIASAAGGIVDIVKNNDTGLLVPAGDAPALAAAIRQAMDNPAEMARLAERGTAFADQAFGWPAIVGQLMTVYESAMKRRTSGEIETGAKQ